MGFSGPPSKPDVHLSLCIRLSKGLRKVRRLHPLELEPHDLLIGHQELLFVTLSPNSGAGVNPAGSEPRGKQLPPRQALMLAPQPQPEPLAHIPVQNGQDALGPNAVR